MLIVVSDEQVLNKIVAKHKHKSLGNYGPKILTTALFDTHGNLEQQEQFLKITRKMPDGTDTYVYADAKAVLLQKFHEFTGTFLFIGIIMSISFIISTGLIIYYKQITEGYHDQKNFIILQKVGMSLPEVKKIVNGQIIWVFFLPIMVALIHLAVATPMLLKILATFDITDFQIIMKIFLMTAAVIIAIYLIIYRLTSKIYLKIVEGR